jgi:hypothetical protein
MNPLSKSASEYIETTVDSEEVIPGRGAHEAVQFVVRFG